MKSTPRGSNRAEHLGIERTAVTKMLAGKRRMLASELPIIAQYIEEAAPSHTGRPSEASDLRFAAFVAYGALLAASEKMPDLKPTVCLLANALGISKPEAGEA